MYHSKSVYHSRRSVRMEQNRWTSDIGGRFRKRITGAHQTQKEPLLRRGAPAEREAREVIPRGYIAGEHSERSPPSVYIYTYLKVGNDPETSRRLGIIYILVFKLCSVYCSFLFISSVLIFFNELSCLDLLSISCSNFRTNNQSPSK